jgi:hypothetical protein
MPFDPIRTNDASALIDRFVYDDGDISGPT